MPLPTELVSPTEEGKQKKLSSLDLWEGGRRKGGSLKYILGHILYLVPGAL